MHKRGMRIVLDSIFPPTVHGRLLREYTKERFARHLSPQPVGAVVSLSHYYKTPVQAAIAACKFERSQHAARLLATLCVAWLETNQTTGITLLIPIPLSAKRQKERGFNQVTRVLHYVPTAKQLKIEERLLFRSLDTVRQTSLGRSDRLNNLKGAFIMSPTIATYDWAEINRVIICDDVLTTGATLEAARAELAPHLPAHVTLVLLAWAH